MKVYYISQGCPLTIFFMLEKKKNPIKKRLKKNEDNFYVYNIFTTNIRWQVIMNSNLNVIKTFLLIKWI